MSSNLADLPLYLPADLTPLVLTSSGQGWQLADLPAAGRSNPLVLTSSGQDEFKFGRSTPWY